MEDASKLGFCQTDCETILSHIKHQDKQLKLKRRWLMGLPMTKSENKKLLRYRSLPESLLRQDDIFYDTVMKHVEEAFGLSYCLLEDNIFQETTQLFERSNLKGILLSCLDALTNRGLFLLAMLLMRGSINFEKTRPKMKKVIKESIPGVGVQSHEDQMEIFMQLCQLLKDPQNVRDNYMTHILPTFLSHHASAIKILSTLEELPSETLLAMLRKLRGDPAGTPRLRRVRHGFSRKKLIHKIRRMSEQMLSELIRGEDLQVPLAKALAVAGLSLKLRPGHSNFFMSDFDQFPPEIKILQNEIEKAILLVMNKTKVRMRELRTLQLHLDPNANVPNSFLRTAIKKMLTEYLFECSDMDRIPKSLSDALAVINRSSQSKRSRCFLNDEIEEDAECILSLSAQMKQAVWDLLPDHEFDEDFADVYMDDLEESDDGGDYIYDPDDVAFGENGDVPQPQPRNISSSSKSCSVDSDNLEESCGDYVPVDSNTSIFNFEGSNGPIRFREESNAGVPNVNANGLKLEKMRKFGTSRIKGNGRSVYFHSADTMDNNSVREQSGTVDLGNPPYSRFYSEGEKFMSKAQSANTNQYLGIQEACDETSLLAYRLIGYMMETYAREESLDLDCSDHKYLRGDSSNQENSEERRTTERNIAGSAVQVLEELIPSLSKSRSF